MSSFVGGAIGTNLVGLVRACCLLYHRFRLLSCSIGFHIIVLILILTAKRRVGNPVFPTGITPGGLRVATIDAAVG